MRLNRFIAEAGVASRRKADELIKAGEVTVNGAPAVIGMEIDPTRDHVKVQGKLIHQEMEKVHILLNKPPGYICTLDDEKNRPLVTELVPEFARLRIYPVGRLDYASEGLILLTNDGDFAARVGHPSTGPEKTYKVKVRGVPDEKTLDKLRNGIRIEDYKTRPAKVRLLPSKLNARLEVVIKEGRNRQIRAMFQAVGHPVVKLSRTKIGPVDDRGLKPGQYRLLTPAEIVTLRSGATHHTRQRPARDPEDPRRPARTGPARKSPSRAATAHRKPASRRPKRS